MFERGPENTAQSVPLDKMPEYKQYIWSVAIVFFLTLAIYSAVFSQFILTNHSIPNIFLSPFPSYRTNSEARWFADLLLMLFGGGGTQSFQALGGFFIQAVSGVLVAILYGVRGRANTTLIAALVALHPVILDYYAFTSDNIGLTLGDALILFGMIVLDRRGRSLSGFAGATLCFVCALAIYPPKISVLAVVALCWIGRRALEADDWKALLRLGLIAAASMLVALLIYWLSVLALIDFSIGRRAHVNAPSEMLEAFIQSYRDVTIVSYLQLRDMYRGTGIAGGLILLLGSVNLLWRATNKGIVQGLVCLAVLALLPAAINIAQIVNSMGSIGIARLVAGFVYALPFFCAVLMSSALPWLLVRILVVVTVYAFAIIGLQEDQFISTKNLYETQLISRIVSRIEEVLPDDKERPLVVIGEDHFLPGNSIVKYPDRPLRPHFITPAFVNYRQPEVANFFIGKPVFRYPSDAETAAALSSAAGKPAWPAPPSVYLEGNTVVVVLEPYHDGIGSTGIW